CSAWDSSLSTHLV
nr:immunoglobulin light chain junction region [Macaca mulatta]MPO10690.1 immunoglobulin light chain junction region [Macaca mulatta]